MIKKQNKRLMLTLAPNDLKRLDEICELLKTKQKSKAIAFLLDYFYKVK